MTKRTAVAMDRRLVKYRVKSHIEVKVQ